MHPTKITLALVVVTCVAAGCPAPGPGEGEGEGEGAVGEGEGAVGEGEGEGEGQASEPFFLAVGFGGRRMSSSDGASWQNDTQDAAGGVDDDNLLRGACGGFTADGHIGVAVGGSIKGRILTTGDGAHYDTTLSDDLGWLGACAVSDDGAIVAIGSARSIRSLDGGASWIDAQTQLFGGNAWQPRDVAFLHGTFVAVTDLGTSVSTDDGASWSAPSGPLFTHVDAGNDAFVAVGNGQRAHSSDGVQWTVDFVAGVKDVVFDQARFVVVGDFLVHLSSDGVTWDEHVGEPAFDLIAFGPQVVNVGTPGTGTYISSTFSNTRRVSSDALAWTDVLGDDGNALAAVAFVP